jgi:hypothetical protein
VPDFGVQLDAGILEWMTSEMSRIIHDGLSQLLPLAWIIFGVCVLLAAAQALLVAMWDASIATLYTLLRILLSAFILTSVITFWQPLTDLLMNTAVTAGLAVTAFQITPGEFLSPGMLAVKGAQITNLMKQWLEIMGWWALIRPDLVLGFSAMTMFTAIIWILMGMNTVMSVFLFKILTFVGFVGLAFMISPATRPFGYSLVRLQISSAMQIFSLAVWVSIMAVLVPGMIMTQLSDMSDWKIVLIMAISFVFLCITVVIPFLVAAGAFVATGSNLLRPLTSRLGL